jgi:hypothetical protein
MADDNKHPKLRPDWKRPAPPDGFDELVCCDYNDGIPELDFVSNTRRDFASESAAQSALKPLGWPWLDGFVPQHADWRAIGIDVIDFR